MDTSLSIAAAKAPQQNNCGDTHPALTKLSVLIPVYNERWTIEEIVSRVLQSPVDLEIELVIVDDGSSDGSWSIVEHLAGKDSRIKAIQHPRNLGKGAAIRTAMDHMTGDVAVVQDADLEYDPREFPQLLAPILEGKADAVFGSRFAGQTRRVLLFWHSVANRCLTLLSNMLNDLNLSDMETGYKMVRSDVLRQLRLDCQTFTFEPELTCRLAQWGARIYEVPISYAGRTYQEGKKIRARDAVKAVAAMFRCRFWDPQFTTHSGFFILTAVAKANRYNRWLLKLIGDFLGTRILEAGAGIGNLSGFFLGRERLVTADDDPVYVARLQRRFQGRRNVRVDRADLTHRPTFAAWQPEQIDTVFCSNVLEHIEPDEQVLASFEELLVPGGHCVIIVPAGPRLHNSLDVELGHFRRYSATELSRKMQSAGFEIVFVKQFNKLGALGWFVSGGILRNRHLSPRQMIWFDRFWPIGKLLDYLFPWSGMSLAVVGRKRLPLDSDFPDTSSTLTSSCASISLPRKPR